MKPNLKPLLLQYAAAVAGQFGTFNLQLKGKGHAPRVAVSHSNSFLKFLPYQDVATTKRGGIAHFVAAEHYADFESQMRAAGVRVDDGAIVSEKAARFALVHFRVGGRPLPNDLAKKRAVQIGRAQKRQAAQGRKAARRELLLIAAHRIAETFDPLHFSPRALLPALADSTVADDPDYHTDLHAAFNATDKDIARDRRQFFDYRRRLARGGCQRALVLLFRHARIRL